VPGRVLKKGLNCGHTLRKTHIEEGYDNRTWGIFFLILLRTYHRISEFRIIELAIRAFHLDLEKGVGRNDSVSRQIGIKTGPWRRIKPRQEQDRTILRFFTMLGRNQLMKSIR